jgi:hypothetical protein
MYMTPGFFRTTAMAVTRPLIPAGPILRGFIPSNLVMSSFCPNVVV